MQLNCQVEDGGPVFYTIEEWTVHGYATHLPGWRGWLDSELSLDPAVALVARHVEDGVGDLAALSQVHVETAHSAAVHVVPEAQTGAGSGWLRGTDQLGLLAPVTSWRLDVHVVTWRRGELL